MLMLRIFSGFFICCWPFYMDEFEDETRVQLLLDFTTAASTQAALLFIAVIFITSSSGVTFTRHMAKSGTTDAFLRMFVALFVTSFGTYFASYAGREVGELALFFATMAELWLVWFTWEFYRFIREFFEKGTNDRE